MSIDFKPSSSSCLPLCRIWDVLIMTSIKGVEKRICLLLFEIGYKMHNRLPWRYCLCYVVTLLSSGFVVLNDFSDTFSRDGWKPHNWHLWTEHDSSQHWFLQFNLLTIKFSNTGNIIQARYDWWHSKAHLIRFQMIIIIFFNCTYWNTSWERKLANTFKMCCDIIVYKHITVNTVELTEASLTLRFIVLYITT